MPLEINREGFITCAVTGSSGTRDRSAHVPRSPEQIAASAIDAAEAGVAVVRCHVRDPTGKPWRDVHLDREVTECIRDGNLVAIMDALPKQNGGQGWGAVASQQNVVARLRAAAEIEKD